MLALGRPLEFLWTWDVDLPPRKLWAIVSDTSRMNRAMGLSRMHFEELEDGVVRGTSKNAGVAHEWIELPWSWVAGRSLGNVRDYRRGFTRLGRGIYLIDPVPADAPAVARSRFTVYFGWIPRGPLSRLLLRFAGQSMGRAFHRAVEELGGGPAVAELDGEPGEPYRPPPGELAP